MKTKKIYTDLYLSLKFRNQGWLSLLVFMLMACNNTEQPLNMGYDYFPVDTGRYYIYNVDSIYIDCAFNINDTFHYQLKETYPSTFQDASDEQAVNVTRYYRTSSSQPWTLLSPDVWWLKKTENGLVKVEENLAYRKMVFPVANGFKWDGNAFNSLGTQNYFYNTPDIYFNNDYGNYDSTITVCQRKDTTWIDHYFKTETYARNIGMVDKLVINVQQSIVYDSYDSLKPPQSCWQNIPPPYHWYQVNILNRIKFGWLKRYQLVECGFE